jgi:hypothetical protein
MNQKLLSKTTLTPPKVSPYTEMLFLGSTKKAGQAMAHVWSIHCGV